MDTTIGLAFIEGSAMQILLYAIALIWAVTGFLLFSHPSGFREFCVKHFPLQRIKSLAAAPGVVGAVLLVGAATTDVLNRHGIEPM